jgi:hypothetical protein
MSLDGLLVAIRVIVDQIISLETREPCEENKRPQERLDTISHVIGGP